MTTKKKAAKKNGSTEIATGNPEFGDGPVKGRRGSTSKIGELCRAHVGKWVRTPWKVISGRSYVTIARAMSGLAFEGREDVNGVFWARIEA